MQLPGQIGLSLVKIAWNEAIAMIFLVMGIKEILVRQSKWQLIRRSGSAINRAENGPGLSDRRVDADTNATLVAATISDSGRGPGCRGIRRAGTVRLALEPHWISLVERRPCRPASARRWIGKRLIQISDLHAGRLVDTDYLIAALQLVSGLGPDMTVITGDFMSCHGTEEVDTGARVLQHLNPGPLGCFAILGNHDYARGWSRSEVADNIVGRLTNLGIRRSQRVPGRGRAATGRSG